jgi:hypothetical protein
MEKYAQLVFSIYTSTHDVAICIFLLVLVMVALFLQSKRKDDNIMFAHYISIYIVSIGPLELKLPPNYDLGGIICCLV